MSAPDRVDVDIPNTLETKLASRKSTENLRHLQKPPPAKLGENRHHHPQPMVVDVPTSTQSAGTSSGHGDVSTSKSSLTPQQQQQQQHQQHQQQSFIPDYAAWTIGSTDGFKSTSVPANSSSNNGTFISAYAPTSDLASPYKSAILAKCSTNRRASPSPDPSDASTSVASSVTPTPPPPLFPSSPLNLTALSQNIDPLAPAGTDGMHHGHMQQHRHQLQQHSAHPQLLQQPQQQQLPPHQHQQQPRLPINKHLQKLYQTRLLSHPTPAVESLLSSSCEAMGFDIAEMWLRTGPKTHQLTNSHVRPTALDESVRKQLVDVYYGERSAERTHRLSPALCKRAKEAMDVVWVTAHTLHGAEALKCSISDVRTAVAVPVCHWLSDTNITIIYFSIRR